MSIRFFFELIKKSNRGFLHHNLRKLRQPKYMMGLLFTLLFFGAIVWTVTSENQIPDSVVFFITNENSLNFIHILLSIILAIALSIHWLVMPGKLPLAFNETDVNVLFPAPLSSRSVFQFSLLKSQKDNLVGSFFLWTFVSAYFDRLMFKYFILWFVIHMILDMHLKCTRLWKAQTTLKGTCGTQLWRFIISIFVILYCVTVIWYVTAAIGDVKSIIDSSEIDKKDTLPFYRDTLIEQISQSKELLVLISPFIWLLSPLFPTIMSAGPLQWIIPVLMLIFYWEWFVRSLIQNSDIIVLKSNVSPSRRISQRFIGYNRSRVPFTLSSLGRPEVALFWKHFLVFLRWPLTAMTAVAISIPIIFFIFILFIGIPKVLVVISTLYSVMGLFFCVFLLLASFQKDLQSDFQNLELMKTFPIKGRDLLLAKVGAICIWAALISIVLLGIYAASIISFNLFDIFHTMTSIEQEKMSRAPLHLVKDPGHLMYLCSGIFLGYIGLISLVVVIQTFINLFFPGWIPKAKERDNVYSTGQSILVLLALNIATLISVLPAAIIIGLIALSQYIFDIPFVHWEITLFGLLFLVISSIETFILIQIAGRMWDNLDPSQELV